MLPTVVQLVPCMVLSSGPAILEDVLIEVFRMLHTQCKTELDLQNQSSFSKDHTHLSRLGQSTTSSFDMRYNIVNWWLMQMLILEFLWSKLRENKKTAELIKTANLLFNSFEPSYMWDYIARWFEECCRFVFGNKCLIYIIVFVLLRGISIKVTWMNLPVHLSMTDILMPNMIHSFSSLLSQCS